ncbi:MAG TPA: cytochrome c oxidase assembly protein [Pseudonocardiaceae bacterium]|nr:cytochrome c oxidase assembly protein [Pseudonocardiaceae bacterium]
MFSLPAVQNLLLRMVAPMLLALGAPFTLLSDLLPSGQPDRLAAAQNSLMARPSTTRYSCPIPRGPPPASLPPGPRGRWTVRFDPPGRPPPLRPRSSMSP